MLCALTASQSQSQERVWHSTTSPTPTTSPLEPDLTTSSSPPAETTIPVEPDLTTSEATTIDVPAVTFTTPTPEPIEYVLPEEITDAAEVVPEETVVDESGTSESPELVDSETSEPVQDVLSVEVIEELENAAQVEKTHTKKKPRKWMSVPEEQIPEEIVDDADSEFTSSTEATLDEANEYTINGTDFELPQNISKLLEAAEEEGIPMIQETIVSKKTTIYVTITESLGDSEPLYVNLTGIRDFTGKERRIVSGCLDLSDLQITGQS